MWGRVSTFIFAGVLSAQAFAGQFGYKVEFIMIPSADCKPLAETMRTAFKATTGIEALSVLCESEAFRYDDGSDEGADAFLGHYTIRYEAEKRLPATSTFQASTIAQGNFKTLEACQDAIDSEKKLFEKQTGVEPLLAECAFDSYHRGLRFFVRMDSLVDTEVKLSTNNLEVLGVMNRNFADVEKEIAERAEQFDLPVLNTRVEATSNFIDSFRLSLRTFVKKGEAEWFNSTLAEFKSTRQCEAAASGITKALSDMNEPYLTSFCLTREHFDEANFMVFAKYGAFEVYQDWMSYSSASDCTQNLDQEVERAKSQLGLQSAGGFCYTSGGSTHLSIIYKRN